MDIESFRQGLHGRHWNHTRSLPKSASASKWTGGVPTWTSMKNRSLNSGCMGVWAVDLEARYRARLMVEWIWDWNWLLWGLCVVFELGLRLRVRVRAEEGGEDVYARGMREISSMRFRVEIGDSIFRGY